MNKKPETSAETNDYLWDGSGTPDPEIQRLEGALQKYRAIRNVPPVFPQTQSTADRNRWRLTIPSIPWVPRFAAATVLAVAIVFAAVLARFDFLPTLTANGWEVELTPTQASGASSQKTLPRKSRLRVGETLETDRASTASIFIAEAGRLDLEPGTRVRLLQSAEARKRVALNRGTIHAAIWAPPGQFVVDTPSAVAVDLGCMYTLHVDESGDGLLRTTLGWVGFRSRGRESLIPAGAAVITRVQSGPGTPYFEDASDFFRSTLAQFDASSDASTRHAALQAILREARFHDGLTLWHLLSRTSDQDRADVFDRLVTLVPPPNGVTREGILGLDRAMLDSWWNALGLGDIGLWRHWEQSWVEN